MLDARRNLICTSAHIGKSLVHTLTGGKCGQKIKLLRNNSDKPGFSNEAAAANECSPVTVKDARSVPGAGKGPLEQAGEHRARERG
jgi:hypothetical protein